MEIKLDHVTYKHNIYSDDKFFNDISLNIEGNTICGIIGKSGCGKTTLLEILGGLNKPVSGKVLIDSFSVERCRKDIGFLFQFPEKQFFEVTVGKEIEFACKNYHIKRRKVLEVIKLVGLNASILDKKIKVLSNGEKRLVALASILVYNPKIILLDEPTIGLDYKNKKKVINIIKNLKNRYEKTIIIVSHEIDLLYELCDNLIVLSDGKIILYGDPESIYNEEKIIKEYDITMPKVLLFENIAREKGIKLLKSKSINDLIKEVYRNV